MIAEISETRHFVDDGKEKVYVTLALVMDKPDFIQILDNSELNCVNVEFKKRSVEYGKTKTNEF